MTTLLVAKILLTFIATVQGLAPMRADFNSTHATNPTWTSHARFHVVWQVLLQAGVSVTVLVLLWAFPSRLHTWIAAALVFNWTLTFFATVSSMSLFDGSLKDEGTGIRPFVFRVGSKKLEVDTNLFGAIVLGTLTMVAAVLLSITP